MAICMKAPAGNGNEEHLPPPDATGPVEAVMTNFLLLPYIFSSMDPRDASLYMTPGLNSLWRDEQTGETRDWRGGIRSVCKDFRYCFDTFAPKIINYLTFKAYNLDTLSLIMNIVSLEIYLKPAEVDNSKRTRRYIAFVNKLQAKQLRGLACLQIQLFSSYELVVNSDFFSKVVPELESARGALPLQLRVFTTGFTNKNNGHFFSQQAMETMLSSKPSDLGEGERAVIRLIRGCQTLELTCALRPHQVLCAMKLAASATTLRLSSVLGGLLYVSEQEQDLITRDIMGGDPSKVVTFPNFKRLEIKNLPEGMEFVNTALFKSLCYPGARGNPPFLAGVAEVLIDGFPSALFRSCIALPSVQRVELRNITLLENQPQSREPVLKETRFMERNARLVCDVVRSCFPSAKVVKLGIEDSAEVARRYTGQVPLYLKTILGMMHDFAQSREGGLLLRVCHGMAAVSGLLLRPSHEKETRCFLLGTYNGDHGRVVSLQLSPSGPCCGASKVVCRVDLGESHGSFRDMYMKCQDCCTELHPDSA